jgi:hypothetical protein
MASILKVDKIVDSGSNVLATSSGSGYAIDSEVTIPAAGVTGTLGSGVKGGAMAKGTVSESSGTPTGDIFERGSNSNGEYVKHADGTMICTIKDIAANSGQSVNWTFPASFATGTEPICIGTAGSDPYRLAVSGDTDQNNTVWSFRAYNLDDLITDGVSYTGAFMNLSAIGRWY